jgi:hypothetical protein
VSLNLLKGPLKAPEIADFGNLKKACGIEKVIVRVFAHN